MNAYLFYVSFAGLGLSLERAGLGPGLGLEGAGLDYNTGICSSNGISTGSSTCRAHQCTQYRQTTERAQE